MKVLIVDDSVFYRRLLGDIVGSFSGLEIIGQAKSAEEALQILSQNQADLVFLDIVMPGMDGLTALSEVKKLYPKIQVVMVSSANRTQADITIKALSCGALDFVPKPEGLNIEENAAKLKDKLQPLIEEIMGIKVHTRPVEPKQEQQTQPVFPAVYQVSQSTVNTPTATTTTKPGASRQRFDLVAIGVSTGGPDALHKVVPLLTRDLNVPVVIVQHMPPVFTASLAEYLNKASELDVKEASQGEVLKPNTVYIAPGGLHMILKRTANSQVMVDLNEGAMENGCRPAVDVLFRSIPNCYQGNVLSVIMTGLGSDGTKGVEVLKQHGGYCLSQSAETCVVYGMPRSVDEAGLSDERLELDKLASRIEGLVCRNRSLNPL